MIAIELMVLFIAPMISGNAESRFRYDAAVYSPGPAFANRQRLILFPLHSAKDRSIPLPFPLGLFAIGSDGKTLYAQRGIEAPGTIPRAGIFKIEFNPTRVNLVPGSAAFRATFSLAVSSKQDKIAISGTYWDGTDLRCGVFQLNMIDGSIKQILRVAQRDRANAQTYLSFAPDGSLAAAIQHNSLEVIDLPRETAKSVGDGFYKAGWSPDGKWIAALEHNDREGTVLFDAESFREQRVLKTSDVHWSPDSRYLLAWKWQASCGPDVYSLETIDVQTGATSVIESSKCKVAAGISAWVSDSVVP